MSFFIGGPGLCRLGGFGFGRNIGSAVGAANTAAAAPTAGLLGRGHRRGVGGPVAHRLRASTRRLTKR